MSYPRNLKYFIFFLDIYILKLSILSHAIPLHKIQLFRPFIFADQESFMSNITFLEYVVITDVEILFLIALRPRKLFLYFANYIFYANTGDSNNPELQQLNNDTFHFKLISVRSWLNQMSKHLAIPK